ncbi:MAG: hypothetical protein NC430_12235 [bacterium]|nr:hypothetical protein [bacterium]
MGRQSARMYYQGKDHKDVYFQGNYHRAMYVGDELVWMKLGGENYIPIMRRNSEGGSTIYLYYPESKSVEKILDREYFASTSVDGNFRFNGTFLFTADLKTVSKDGKNFSEYDYSEDLYQIYQGAIGGGVNSAYQYLLDNNGKLISMNTLFTGALSYEGIRSVGYFKKYYFFRGSGQYRHYLYIARDDGYKFPAVHFLRGIILYYINLRGAHTFLVAQETALYAYQSRNLSTWDYWWTGINTATDSGNGHVNGYYLSCVYDGEKYLLYVLSNNKTLRNKTVLYETYDFVTFTNVPLPAYITLNGMKEDSTWYLVTDETEYFSNPPDVDIHLVYDREVFFSPQFVGESSTLLYNNGIKINPRSILSGGYYIDNLYLQESENNMVIDFWED